jgi:hypothetical protein
MSKYITIKDIVNDLQVMIDDTSYDKDAQIYQLRLLALQGLRELTFDAEQRVKAVDKVVNSNLSFATPNDLVNIKRIGFLDDENVFHPFSNDNNLSLLVGSKAKNISGSKDDENNPYYHTDLGKKFGVGGGQNSLGYYRHDREDNIIFFSSNLKGKTVYLEYIADTATSTNPKVHVFCEEALRCYVYYKYIQRKRGVPANEKQMAKRAYYNEKRLARARMMNFSKEQAMQVSRKAFKQSPKI